jgi:membrane protease YdiL (CAAX protease family)
MSAPGLKSSWPAVHGGLFVAAFILIPFSLPTLGWPWYLLVPLVGYAAFVLLVPTLRRTIPRIPFGRINKYTITISILLAALTSAVLTGYQALLRPDVSALAAAIPVAAFGSVIVAGVCFSIGNAVLEELTFRWVLYEALAAEWGAIVAVAATAVIFGLGHMHGYPPGPAGAVLAGLYGVALGLLRWWTGGLGLAIGCHIAADATIFTILANQGAFTAAARP